MDLCGGDASKLRELERMSVRTWLKQLEWNMKKNSDGVGNVDELY